MRKGRFDLLAPLRSDAPSGTALKRLAALLTHLYAGCPLVVREERLAWLIVPVRFVADDERIHAIGARGDGLPPGAWPQHPDFRGRWTWRRLISNLGQGHSHLHLNRRLGDAFVRCMASGGDLGRGYECWLEATQAVPGDHTPFDPADIAWRRLRELWEEQSPAERSLNFYFAKRLDRFVRWPHLDFVLMPVVRGRSAHRYPEPVVNAARVAGVKLDRRSNGPAIAAFELAGGERPIRHNGNGWNIHHIYDGRFPLFPSCKVTHAVKSEQHFTHSAGLIAIHPAADGLASDSPFFAWWLRLEAFWRFRYDPDRVFS